MSFIIRFLRDQDQFSMPISHSYKGNTVYGTICGGLVSLIASTFFMLFFSSQLYTWISNPTWS